MMMRPQQAVPETYWSWDDDTADDYVVRSFVEASQRVQSAEHVWITHQRANDMLWLQAYTVGDVGSDRHRRLVLCACDCARLSLSIPNELNKSSARRGSEYAVIAWYLYQTERWARGDIESVPRKRDEDEPIGSAPALAQMAAGAAQYPGWAAQAAEYTANIFPHPKGAELWAGKKMALAVMADIVRVYFPLPPSVDELLTLAGMKSPRSDG